jgi:hypothetical protein
MMTKFRPRGKHLFLGLFLALSSIALAREARAQIKQPGAHPDYAVELDPHLTIQHSAGPFWDDEGVGLGLRASIPLVRNGPIPQINNNMAIGFGGDIAFFGDDNGCRNVNNRFLGDSCDGTDLVLPVVWQWNFFFTKVVGAFFEIGPAVTYWHRSWIGDCGGEPCELDASDLDFEPIVGWIGGRFLFGERVGMTVRLGWPYISVGGTFLL